MSLDTTFDSNIDALIDYADASSVGEQNQDLGAWYLGDLDLWSGDTLDVDAINKAFSREAVGDAYGTIFTADDGTAGEGTVGEAASCVLQSDYLAVIERAFRMRHASPIRSRAQAAARRIGHSHDAGCIARVRSYAQDLITAGES